MRGAVIHAPGDVRIEERADPTVQSPTGAVIRCPRPPACTASSSAPSACSVCSPRGNWARNPIRKPEPPSRLIASLVRFTPGARTNWHSHANGQTLPDARAATRRVEPRSAR